VKRKKTGKRENEKAGRVFQLDPFLSITFSRSLIFQIQTFGGKKTMAKKFTSRASARQNNHRNGRYPRGPDKIGLVGFNDKGFVISNPANAHSHTLVEPSQKLHEYVTGVTNMTDGLLKGVEMCERSPRGVLRRIWLLSDGYPNRENDGLMAMVERAKNSYININTIGFGDTYDEALLRQIASATHNGKFVPVTSLRELTNALVAYGSPTKSRHGDGNNGKNKRDGGNGNHRRMETTVFAIDLSGSMRESMDGKTKVKVVEEAILHLLHYKQQLFS
jgi:Mg-chelatase subunit ChlD